MSKHRHDDCELCREEEYEIWEHNCIHASMDQNEAWRAKYKIGTWERWEYSLKDATLTFLQNGSAKVLCEIQAVGTVQNGSWEWSWGNKNLPDSCKARMSEVRDFGERRGWDKLTSLFLENYEELGWECASVSTHLLDGTAVYRCPDERTPGYFLYLVILSSRYVN